MKIQLTVFISFLVAGFLLMAQASETETKPDAEEATSQPAVEDVVSQEQKTPDVISELDEEIEPVAIPVDKLPRIPSSMDPQQQALFRSANAGRLSEVQALVAEGVPVNYQDMEKRTALILAANNGHTSVVEFLFSKGADINVADKDGMTALMYATRRSFNETAAFLLNNGADVNVQSRKKKITALMLASAWGNKELVQMLLDKGANPATRNIQGRDAAFYADKRGHKEITKILSESEASDQE